MDEQGFLFAWPVRTIVGMRLVVDDSKQCVPLFSDADLAERSLEDWPNAEIREIWNFDELGDFLEVEREDNATHIAIDSAKNPSGIAPFVADITEAIEWLRTRPDKSDLT